MPPPSEREACGDGPGAVALYRQLEAHGLTPDAAAALVQRFEDAERHWRQARQEDRAALERDITVQVIASIGQRLRARLVWWLKLLGLLLGVLGSVVALLTA